MKNEMTICFLLLSLLVHAGLLKRIYYNFETCLSVWPTFFLLNVINAQELTFIFLFGVFFCCSFFFKSARLIKTALEIPFFHQKLIFFAFLNPKL